MPESSAMAGRAVRCAALRALISAFSRNVVPVAGGGSTPKSDCRTSVRPLLPSISENSRSFPGFPLASTTRRVDMIASTASGGPAHLLLEVQQPRGAGGREVEQCIQLVTAEFMSFGRALPFDETSAVVHH